MIPVCVLLGLSVRSRYLRSVVRRMIGRRSLPSLLRLIVLLRMRLSSILMTVTVMLIIVWSLRLRFVCCRVVVRLLTVLLRLSRHWLVSWSRWCGLRRMFCVMERFLTFLSRCRRRLTRRLR